MSSGFKVDFEVEVRIGFRQGFLGKRARLLTKRAHPFWVQARTTTNGRSRPYREAF
jgi:hypothetical protein